MSYQMNKAQSNNKFYIISKKKKINIKFILKFKQILVNQLMLLFSQYHKCNNKEIHKNCSIYCFDQLQRFKNFIIIDNQISIIQLCMNDYCNQSYKYLNLQRR
ncbi:unnamed protein product [Paramecium primaurelia]|uniref:Uncharacterized protein n=1 Tax=Paramecium primaurelia TaxID=5886 RepID=A0A8S1P5D4_PARPR|nr:unnamed protein product [Paramecium primaurelia]